MSVPQKALNRCFPYNDLTSPRLRRYVFMDPGSERPLQAYQAVRSLPLEDEGLRRGHVLWIVDCLHEGNEDAGSSCCRQKRLQVGQHSQRAYLAVLLAADLWDVGVHVLSVPSLGVYEIVLHVHYDQGGVLGMDLLPHRSQHAVALYHHGYTSERNGFLVRSHRRIEAYRPLAHDDARSWPPDYESFSTSPAYSSRIGKTTSALLGGAMQDQIIVEPYLDQLGGV